MNEYIFILEELLSNDGLTEMLCFAEFMKHNGKTEEDKLAGGYLFDNLELGEKTELMTEGDLADFCRFIVKEKDLPTNKEFVKEGDIDPAIIEKTIHEYKAWIKTLH